MKKTSLFYNLSIIYIIIAVLLFSAVGVSAVNEKQSTSIQQYAATANSISVKWLDYLSSNVKYDLKISNGKNAKRIYKNIIKSTYTIKKLHSGKRYYIKIRAIINGRKGNWSKAFFAITAPKVNYKWSNGSLKVNWTKMKFVSTYNIRISLNSNRKDFVRKKGLDNNSYTFTDENYSNLRINKSFRIAVVPYIDKNKLFAGYKTTKAIEIIGHRGRMDIAPENTIASFEEANKSGYDSVEADFYETKSGDILISHSQTLSQCASNEDVRNLTNDSRMNYPIVNGKNIELYPTQYLPTMKQLMKTVSDNHMKLYLHMKDPNMTDKGLKKIKKYISKYKLPGKVTVFSSNGNAFKRIVKAKIRAGFLKFPTSKSQAIKYINFAKNNSAKVVIFKYEQFIDSSVVKIAKQNNLKIGCYNINNIDLASDFTNLGADFLITNNDYIN